ncbi:MAG: SDR family oxidoreductase [Myxococcaceae bacterium]|nr:MAG: SDR family oxidoreductase [Myxococcaceae bacterium]
MNWTNAYTGKRALVSGAGSGIGEAAAVALRAAGATVYGLTSNPTTLAAARAKHPEIRWLSADLGKRAEVELAVKSATAEGRLDLLVNNAGIYKFASLEASEEAMVRSQFDVNVLGAIFLTQAALPALRASRGAIVNVSSTSARKASPGQVVYAATKGALESFTRALASELATDGIRVNAVAPGPTMTGGIAKIDMPPEVRAAAMEQMPKMIPLGRTGTAEEVAHWILTLGDPGVTWVTGQIVGVDGGMTAG